MAYLAPDYEYDVFVSYSHGDPLGHGDSPLKRWTVKLVNELVSEIRAVDTEFDNLNIWLDEQIDPTAHLTDELRQKVSSSGVLLIVMSPRYLASSWCRDELEWFRAQVHDRAREQGRVFVVRALPTIESNWPDFLRDQRGHSLVGFRFHDPQSNMPFGWRDMRETNEEYVRQLWRLQTALTKRLRELNERAVERARAREQEATAPVRKGGTPRIYVHARGDQGPVRSEVQRQLTQLGIMPLSPPIETGDRLVDWTRESKARFEAARRCDALALVRADGDESFIGELLDIGVDERERIQTARGSSLPCAVFDGSGTDLPIDVSPYGIQRFDVADANWGTAFREWLDQSGAQGQGAG